MLENYKIKVKDESESKEAQELFFELGYEKSKQCNWLVASCIQFLATDGDFLHCWDDEKFGGNRFESLAHKELTLPQIRDLVVLKRNDVKDANYKSATDFYYITVDNRYYFWNGSSWCLFSADFISGLSPIIDNQINQDPALISGADALRALADGKEVEFKHDTQGWVPCLGLNIEQVVGGLFQLRIKPQTIKLELELPKPFKPNKAGEKYYFIHLDNDNGYSFNYFESKEADACWMQCGAWRTEDEIKQVVEQLRKIRGV